MSDLTCWSFLWHLFSMHSFSNHKDGSKLRFVFGVSRDVVIRRYVDSPPSFPGTPFPCKTAKIWKKTPHALTFYDPLPLPSTLSSMNDRK